MLTNYKVDAIYAEGILMIPGYCYCEFCREILKNKYGKEIHEDINDRDYSRFVQESLANIYRKIREVINRCSPHTVFIGGNYWPHLTNVQDPRDYVDVVAIERQWGYQLTHPFYMPLCEQG